MYCFLGEITEESVVWLIAVMLGLFALAIPVAIVTAGIEADKQKKEEKIQKRMDQCTIRAVRDVKLTYKEGSELCVILLRKKQ